MITTRLASAADANAIALLSRQSFHDTFAAFNSKEDMDKFMNESFSMKSLIAETTLPEHIFIVAFNGAELVGYAKLTHSQNPPALGNTKAIEISRLYADKKSIGTGTGKLLMLECLAIAKREGKELVWLGVWEHNERAKTFYARFGFEKFGEHDFILGDDVQTDWLMKKML